MRDPKLHIALFHALGEVAKKRVDFKFDKPVTKIFEMLKLADYKLYQLIQSENMIAMPMIELENPKIKLGFMERVEKTWLGLNKPKRDMLIFPNSDFYYPYNFGNYTYLFSKNEYTIQDIEIWINTQFPNRWSDLDNTYAGHNTLSIKLIDKDDYLIITNYDYQSEFGIIGKKSIIESLLVRFREMRLDDYEEENYTL